jgi:hypothetical protein
VIAGHDQAGVIHLGYVPLLLRLQRLPPNWLARSAKTLAGSVKSVTRRARKLVA